MTSSHGFLRLPTALLGVSIAFVSISCGSFGSDDDDVVWKPTTESTIAEVRTDDVRDAIEKKVAGTPPEGVSAETWRHVRSLYEAYDGQPLWLDENGVAKRRTRALATALDSAEAHALNIDVLPLDFVARASDALEGDVDAGRLADADLSFSALYVALGRDLLAGQVKPRAVAQSWHIDPRADRTDSTLARVLRVHDLERSLASLRPHDTGYDALRQKLVEYRHLVADGGWPSVPKGRALKPGDTDSRPRLVALAERLAREGLLEANDDESTTGGARMSYDTALAGAVARFQRRHAIVVDSMLGEETVAALNVPADVRLAQIAANLERYRWLPRSLGAKYLLVNVPAFTLQAFEGGRETLTMKVIVGAEYEGRATPVFSDSMQYVVFRPYWDVTDSIAIKELQPKSEQDPTFFERNNYEVVRGDGKERIRQKPGPGNALGLVKFIFPNDFAIYLHDTPEDELFEKDVRAFSHGCIRLERPAELAQWVLGWPADSVQRMMHGEKDDYRVDLPQKIPVYIVYFTTFVRDGELYFGNDLYQRDETLIRVVANAASGGDVARRVKELRKRIG
jgi:murein L,D-transpeptidase YcbB/YkuD